MKGKRKMQGNLNSMAKPIQEKSFLIINLAGKRKVIIEIEEKLEEERRYRKMLMEIENAVRKDARIKKLFPKGVNEVHLKFLSLQVKMIEQKALNMKISDVFKFENLQKISRLENFNQDSLKKFTNFLKEEKFFEKNVMIHFNDGTVRAFKESFSLDSIKPALKTVTPLTETEKTQKAEISQDIISEVSGMRSRGNARNYDRMDIASISGEGGVQTENGTVEITDDVDETVKKLSIESQNKKSSIRKR